jgi:GDP-L-fucose synthase
MLAPNKVILITGGSGMLGSAVVRYFSLNGFGIIAPNSSELDLRDRVATFNFFQENNIRGVIHCAAKVGGISANIDYPLDHILENLLIDTSLIDAAVKFLVPNFIYVGSSCMYPRDLQVPFTEEDLLTGKLEPTNSGYAIAKLSGSHAVISAAKQKNLNWKVIIPSNLYGPGDSTEPEKSHMIASIVMKLLKAVKLGSSEVEVWGDGTARREFTYVDDVANFLASNWNSLADWPSLMNVGFGQDLTVKQFYELVADILNFKGDLKYNTKMPVGMKRKLMDSSLARQFGWSPETSYPEGLLKTVNWYKQEMAYEG